MINVFYSFQAVEGLIQISDGSLDDIDIADVVHRVNPEKLFLDIKKELPKGSELFTNYSNKESVYETNDNPESFEVSDLEFKDEIHDDLNLPKENIDDRRCKKNITRIVKCCVVILLFFCHRLL